MTNNASVVDTLRFAHQEREMLVPIVGAGTSIALGLPSWSELVQRLAAGAPEPPPGHGAALTIDRVRTDLGQAHFTAKIRDLLRLPGPVTSATLQALATAPVRRIITTNLDYAIETAFLKAGAPLSAEQVGRGYEQEELALFDGPSRVLLKVHGSLERPDSWVLTKEQYDKAYVSPGRLKEFLVARVQTPLFIGFSFSDADVNETLRLGAVHWQNRAYAIVHQSVALAKRDEFASHGIIPIPFWNFDHIPEIIDEIFHCAPLQVVWSQRADAPGVVLHVGAAAQAVSDELGFVDRHALLAHPALRAITNALEVQPPQSKLTNLARRQHGIKGSYRADAAQFVRDRDAGSLTLFLRAVAQYRDVFVGGVLPSLLKRADLNEDDYFWLLQHAQEALAGTAAEAEVDEYLLRALRTDQYDFGVRRVSTRLLALRGLHPALFVPPPTVRIGRLDVAVYPLTQTQVAVLRGTSSSAKPSVRPYILKSSHEVKEILDRLCVVTGRNWRVPTEEEWLEFAGLGDGRPWPWGNEPPEWRRHAHLNMAGSGGAVPQGEVEVGLFPCGRSPAGLYDLIGNVHEVVRAHPMSDYRLAGGAWTSKFNTGWTFRAVTAPHYPKPNAGIRPVADVVE